MANGLSVQCKISGRLLIVLDRDPTRFRLQNHPHRFLSGQGNATKMGWGFAPVRVESNTGQVANPGRHELERIIWASGVAGAVRKIGQPGTSGCEKLGAHQQGNQLAPIRWAMIFGAIEHQLVYVAFLFKRPDIHGLNSLTSQLGKPSPDCRQVQIIWVTQVCTLIGSSCGIGTNLSFEDTVPAGCTCNVQHQCIRVRQLETMEAYQRFHRSLTFNPQLSFLNHPPPLQSVVRIIPSRHALITPSS